jgi:hypothetical protein
MARVLAKNSRFLAKPSIGLLARSALAAIGLFALTGAARSEELAAYAGKSVALKDIHGTIYYVPRGEAFDVVVTLDSEGHPFRFTASLRPGQSTTLSAPGAVDEPAAVVEIKRLGDRLYVVDHARQHRADARVDENRAAD